MGFEDSLARYYDEVSPFDEETYQFLKKHSNDGKVLDVGCATGAYATKLSEEDELIVKGIDLREDMINVAKKRIGTASFEVRDMFQIEETNCFNLVYSLDNKIAHLYDYLEIKNVIRIFLEALRKNGYIILEIANFARVFRQTVTELPIIETKHVKLSRHYQRKDGALVA